MKHDGLGEPRGSILLEPSTTLVKQVGQRFKIDRYDSIPLLECSTHPLTQVVLTSHADRMSAIHRQKRGRLN